MPTCGRLATAARIDIDSRIDLDLVHHDVRTPFPAAPMRRSLACIFLAAAWMAAPHLAASDDLPTADALKLSEVAAQLESAGLNPIIEMEFDDGYWEVKALRDGRKRKLRVDPLDGRILSEKDDD